MKKHFLLIVLYLYSLGAFSQNFNWAKQFEGSKLNISSATSSAVDASGNIYTVGFFTDTVDFDPGSGTYLMSTTSYLDDNIFISKLDSLGNFVWAKKTEGGDQEVPCSIVTDASNNIFITGRFSGTVDFDPGKGTYNLTSSGGWEIFVFKLDSNGNFIWAKKMGGTYDEIGYAMALDATGNIYITGFFEGKADFDPGSATYYLTSAGGDDIFILKLNSYGNFVWAKQIGGTGDHDSRSIVIDASGYIYTTGWFGGKTDFDPGSNTYYLNTTGGSNDIDIFVSKLNSSGDFIWAKRMGGTDREGGLSIKIDKLGNVYTTGLFADIVDFDPGVGTYDLTSGGGPDIFISKLDSLGDFLWARSMTGSYQDEGLSIALDYSNNVLVTGYFTGTVDFDPGSSTYNLTSNGVNDVFISKLNSSGNFEWAKQIGGVKADRGESITLDNKGNIYVIGGFSDTVDFDPGSGTYDLSSGKIFILKLSTCSPPSAGAITGSVYVCNGTSATYSISSVTGATGYTWNVPFGASITKGQNTTSINVSFGKYSGNIVVTSSNSCGNGKPKSLSVTVTPLPTVGYTVNPSLTVCKGSSVTLSGTGASTYAWSGGLTNGVTFSATSTINYTVTGIDAKGCKDSTMLTLIVKPLPNIGYTVSPSLKICKGSTVTLNGTGASTYTWTGSITNGKSFIPLSTTTYKVIGTDTNGCKSDSFITVTVKPLPTITNQPSNQTTTVGANVLFTLLSSSSTSTYQWKQNSGSGFAKLSNGGQYSGVTNDTLTISNVTISQNNYSYRCLVTDQGCSDSSKIVLLTVKTMSIKKAAKSKAFSVFPNPAYNFITVSSNQTPNNLPFIITDQIGKQILKGELNNKLTTIDIINLAQGFYFLQIGEVNKEVFKIMKN